MPEMRTKILAAVVLVVIVGLVLVFFIQQGQFGSVFPGSLQAGDFLGQWYNINPNPPTINVAISFSTLLIQENQGTYTLAVVEPCYGCYPFFNFQWSTVLTINPPNAHAFYSFESGGSVDLQLKLLNATSMQVKESFQAAPSLQYGAPTSSYVQVEQFAKVPISYATTSSSATTTVVSTTLTLAPTQGSCGVGLQGGFDAQAGQTLRGSVSASTVIGVYVMTLTAYQAWMQVASQGGSCTPSSFLSSQQGSASYGISVRIPADGTYAYVIVNPSGTTIIVQITLNLALGSSSYSQTVQSQPYVTTTPTTVSTQMTSALGQGTPIYSGTVNLPGASGVCNGYFVETFDVAAGQTLTGSLTATGTVNAFVMTYAEVSTWEYQVGMGQSCMPSSSVASQLNITSGSLTTTIATSGEYYFVVDNISGSPVTAQITINLA